MTDQENKVRECARKEFFNANRRFIGNNGPLVAEAIDAGFDAGAAYALSNQWRDAEKELPEDNADVIAMAKYANATNLGIAWYDENRNGTKQWYSYDDDFEVNFVKYWMPIPAIPEYKPKGK